MHPAIGRHRARGAPRFAMPERSHPKGNLFDGVRGIFQEWGRLEELAYFLIFTPLVFGGVALVAWREVSQCEGVRTAIIDFGQSAAPIVITAAAISVSIVEVGGFVMVLARRYEERRRRRSEEEDRRLRKEIRAEERERIRERIIEANPGVQINIPEDDPEQSA